MKPTLLLFACFLMGSLHILQAQNTDTIPVTTPPEIGNRTSWNIYPNPTNGTFQIVYSSVSKSPPDGWGGKLVIAISNSSGKIVYIETIAHLEDNYSKTIDLSSQPKGIYSVELIVGQKKEIKRIVLN